MLTVLPALALAAAGCGSSGDTVVSDPAPTSAAPSTPTASPTVGSYPAFAAADYSYQLTVSCYCPDAGTPIDVTVAGGRVTAATYAVDVAGRASARAGDPAPDYSRLSIDDVIDVANDTSAASVQVDWPAGQDHPSSVYVDHDANAADDEIGYTVAHVVVR